MPHALSPLRVSVIIPTLNEADWIDDLICLLRRASDERLVEILVVDGGSTDGTPTQAKAAGAQVLKTARRSRAVQMNLGAAHASGNVLYFVHADARPPASYLDDIARARTAGYPIGCYRFAFDSDHLLLKVNAFFTRFDRIMCRGGDQTLFVTRSLYDRLGGYDERYVIMEDFNFIQRAQAAAPFTIMPGEVTVSARKYEHNSYLRVNLANLIVFLMYRLGVHPKTLRATYHRLLQHPKAA